MKKKIAIIGVSGFGQNHFDNISQLADAGLVDLAAAVVRTPAKAALQLEKMRNFGTEIYPDAQSLFQAEKGKIDLVCIPTGIDSHETMTISALEAGMNVLLEKPVSASVASVESMITARKKSRGLFVAVAFQHCYAPEIQFFKTLLIANKLGKIRDSQAIGVWPRGDAYYTRNSWSAKRQLTDGTPVLDSPVNNAFAHYLNLLLFLNGKTVGKTAHVVAVEADLMRARPSIEMFDTCFADFKLNDGTRIGIAFSHAADRVLDPRFRIKCEHGTIEWLNNSEWSVRDRSGDLIASGTGCAPSESMFRRVLSKLADPSVEIYSLENGMEHTACVEILDSTCSIRNVKADFHDGFYVIPGIIEKIEERFRQMA